MEGHCSLDGVLDQQENSEGRSEVGQDLVQTVDGILHKDVHVDQMA